MYKHTTRRTSEVCTCVLHEIATLKKIFPMKTFNLYEQLYIDLPENTIAEKITKLRLMKNLEKKDLARALGFHLDTVIGWEVFNVFPKPDNILSLCEFFDTSPEYFDGYYGFYFSNPDVKLRAWKEKNNFSNQTAADVIGISTSAFARLLSGKLKPSVEMYLKLKEVGAV